MTTLKTLALGLNRFLSRLFSDDPETIDYLNGADSLPPPLNKEEEKKAFELLRGLYFLQLFRNDKLERSVF